MIKKVKKNCVMFVTAMLIVMPALNAQELEKRHITQDESVQLAIKNNLSLESQRITTAGQKRKSDLFWNQFIPSVSLSGGLIGDNEKPAPTSTPLGDIEISNWHTMWQVQVQLNLPIFALGPGIRSLKLDYQNGLITYEKAKLQLERDVRKSYNSILLLEEQLNLQQQSFENAKAQAESARINYLSGRSPELQWMQAEVTAKNKQPTIDQLKNAVTTAKNNLAMSCGLDFDAVDLDLEPIADGTNFASLQTEELVKQALDKKPDILDMKAQLQTVQMQRKAQLLGYWTPALSLSWNTQNIYTATTGARETDFFEPDDWIKSGGFQIMFSWTATNLLPFSQNNQSVKATDDNISKLSIGLTQLIQGTEIDVYNKVFSLDQTRQSMAAQKSTLDLAERSYSATLTAYNSGLQSFLQVDQSEEQLRSARLKMQEQKIEYINGLIDLEYSIGVPFGTYSSLN
ncbi:MAG: hypothetical protein Ta2B_20190 [Termitinemataceae bacterium]|nr:MAG: hypothetical protein Ta2B_20190 [Termitinemataceae bacterium]